MPDFSSSRAVLIGVGTYTHLPPVGAALNSLARFASVLTGPLCGWPTGQTVVLSDVRQPGKLPDRLVKHFEAVRDVALFYYVGHGQVDPFDTLCLGLVDSRTEAIRRRTTSLPFDAVRHALASSRARAKIVILDCCYAGLAAEGPGALTSPDLLNHTRGTGAYTLAAAGEFATAWYDTDPATPRPQTYFTQYLADVIEAGIPGEGPHLALEPIFYATLDALARDGKPLPTSRATGQATRIPFARNAAASPHPRRPTTQAPSPKDTARKPSSPAPTTGTPEPFALLSAAARNLPPLLSRRRALIALSTVAAASVIIPLVLRTSPSDDLRPTLFGVPLVGHTDSVEEVALGVLNGKTIAVSGSRDDTVRVWDLATTTQLGAPLTGHTRSVFAMAVGVLDGRTIAVSGGYDQTLRRWDLATATQIGDPIEHISSAEELAVGSLNGKAIAVSGSGDKTLRRWDLAAGTELGNPLTGHNDTVAAVALGVLNGKAIAVSGSHDRTLRRWDLAAGTPSGPPFTGHGDSVYAVAVGTLNDRAIAVSGSGDKTLRIWDLAAGTQLGAPLTGHTEGVKAVALGTLNGEAIAVSGSDDKTLRVWDLANGTQLGNPITGHTEGVKAVAVGTLNGRTIAVSGSGDRTLRVWILGPP
ncbi:hypothetical protein ACIBG8_08590 [Nonomuraea sp. NPDC050556]|uniref:caspase, EACC1-associated type n=1 Tax=Nonomuraea sp. NPDC050556 TaxID=3364369 RepID=UPI0037B0F5B1